MRPTGLSNAHCVVAIQICVITSSVQLAFGFEGCRWHGEVLLESIASGRGAAWLARLLGVQEVPGSNPGGPTKRFKDLQTTPTSRTPSWSPFGVHSESTLYGVYPFSLATTARPLIPTGWYPWGTWGPSIRPCSLVEKTLHRLYGNSYQSLVKRPARASPPSPEHCSPSVSIG